LEGWGKNPIIYKGNLEATWRRRRGGRGGNFPLLSCPKYAATPLTLPPPLATSTWRGVKGRQLGGG